MSDIAIRVENLSKLYRIRERRRYRTLRDAIAETFATPFRGRSQVPVSPSAIRHPPSETIWALKDVSLEIKHGEVVGIIGRNGAGKSTLLKILSRITEPTEGEARIYGRVGSLLEVGTGFHPELTGRENIYLNGAILGMKKAEINRKFDEIVAFAEIEKFLDTPVKHYSSGMHMRLAFSVAAHLEPEIVIVDEVLAVGDAEFQKKCLGKMGEVAKGGRTVLFVSHNMGAVDALCHRAMCIEHGSLVHEGQTATVIAAYLAYQQEQSAYGRGWYSVDSDLLHNQQFENFKFTAIELYNHEQASLDAVTGEPLLIKIKYTANGQFVSPVFWVSVKDVYGLEIVRFSTMPISGYPIQSLFPEGRIDLLMDALPLVGGHYYVDIAFARESIDFVVKLDSVVQFDVRAKDVYGSGVLLDRSRGLIAVNHHWNHRASEKTNEATGSNYWAI